MQTLASNVAADDFTDVGDLPRPTAGSAARSARSCARAPTPSTSPQFVVITDDKVYFLPLNREEDDKIRRMAAVIGERAGFAPVVIKGTDDLVGIVTVHDGPCARRRARSSRPSCGEDPAASRTYHNNFQDPERFLAAGGTPRAPAPGAGRGHVLHQPPLRDRRDDPEDRRRGRAPSASSCRTRASAAPTSRAPSTSTASSCAKGTRGVWSEPLLPGQVRVQHVRRQGACSVPTTNFILKWNKARGRLAPLRREPLRGLAHHQGRVRAARCRSRSSCTSTTRRRRSSSSASATSSGSSSRRSTRW